MNGTTYKALRKTVLLLKRVLLSNKMMRNAVMDVLNTTEFTNIYEHEKMLADRVRMETYRKAIARHIKKEDVVVDLGTGTGILSLFAAGNRPAKIYAIDHSDFIEVAKEIAARKTDYQIHFEKVNSRSFNPSQKLDVILHEQIGDDLFEENMIENILDLKRRVLKENGRIIPGKFELYLEPLCLKPEYQVPFLWENNHCGIDFGFLKNSPLIEKYMPDNYRRKYVESGSVDHFLCHPEPVLSFDLNDQNFTPDFNIGRLEKRVSHTGFMDGVCLFFKVIFDDDISFDTPPLSGKSSWGNHLFRTERTYLEQDTIVMFDVRMEDYLLPETWEIDFKTQQPEPFAQHEPAIL